MLDIWISAGLILLPVKDLVDFVFYRGSDRPQGLVCHQGSHFNFWDSTNCNLCVTQEFFMDHISRLGVTEGEKSHAIASRRDEVFSGTAAVKLINDCMTAKGRDKRLISSGKNSTNSWILLALQKYHEFWEFV